MNFLIGAFLLALVQGHAISMTAAPAVLHPGSPFVLSIRGLAKGTAYDIGFDKRMLPVSGNGGRDILLGVDLAHPVGTDRIKLYARGMTVPVTFTTVQIQSHAYASQYLTLPEHFVTFTPSQLKRIFREQSELDRIFARDKTRPLWHTDFIMPVNGPITAPFGVKRFFNGQPRSPHTGIDIAAAAGTPVVATNDGIVCFTGKMFFGGRSVLINHGQGIYSMYFHLRKYAVKKGMHVKKGQTIGYVGESGRVTGPALHFGIRIMDSRIDPLLLFSLTKKME